MHLFIIIISKTANSVDPDQPVWLAQLDVRPVGVQEVRTPARSATFVEIDHEIVPTVILSLLLIQKG